MFDEFFDVKDVMPYLKANNTFENREKLLKSDKLRAYYCKYIQDSSAVWLQLTEDYWICWYLKFVKKRGVLRRRIANMVPDAELIDDFNPYSRNELSWWTYPQEPVRHEPWNKKAFRKGGTYGW